METEAGGRVAAKENVDPVANRGAISPEMDAHEEKELRRLRLAARRQRDAVA